MTFSLPKLLTGLVVALFLFGSAPEKQTSKLLSRDPSAPPVWVSAEAATTAAGEIDWEILGERAHQMYQGVLQSTPFLLSKPPGDSSPPEYDPDSSGLTPECVQYGAAFYDSLERGPDDTFQGVLKNAPAIVRGRITDLTPGFYKGDPATLLTVEVEKFLRRSRQFSRQRVIYVVYPYARFGIGDVNFCKQDSSFPYRPALEDRIMLFPYGSPGDASQQLVRPDSRELIFESTGGRLVLPKAFASNPESTRPLSLGGIEEKLIEKN